MEGEPEMFFRFLFPAASLDTEVEAMDRLLSSLFEWSSVCPTMVLEKYGVARRRFSAFRRCVAR